MNDEELTLESALAQADGHAERINAVWPPPVGPSEGIVEKLETIDAIIVEAEKPEFPEDDDEEDDEDDAA